MFDTKFHHFFSQLEKCWFFGLGIFLISLLTFSNIAYAEDTNTQFFCKGWLANDGSGADESFTINFKWDEETSDLKFNGRYKFWGVIPYVGKSDIGYSVFLKDSKTPVFMLRKTSRCEASGCGSLDFTRHDRPHSITLLKVTSVRYPFLNLHTVCY